MARLQHPNLPGAVEDVPDSAVGQLAMSGWVPAEGEPVPTCPTCGSTWPVFGKPAEPLPLRQQTDEAPADAGASASKGTRRRASKEGGE